MARPAPGRPAGDADVEQTRNNMNQARQERFLSDHIPYRLRAMDLFRFACEVRLAQRQPAKVEIP